MEGKIRMTWRELNDQLGKTKDGKLVLKFYKAERKGKRRRRWLRRIYHRYSYLRRKQEMKAVASGEAFV
jgi:hypothetical protein